MKRCPTRPELEEFLEETLPSSEAERIARHVSDCGDCQAQLERLTDSTEISSVRLRAAPPLPESSVAFLERLKQADSASLGGGRGGRRGVDAAELKPPEIEGYHIHEILGRGGMGVVYRAEQIGLNRTVALKMILAGPHASPRDHARFRQEAEAAARLHHPNIVQVFDVGESEGRPYFALEYVAGGSLAKHLRGDPQAVRPTVWLVEQLAEAVDYAHRHGVVHRDLKPANILIADFGAADSRTGDAGLALSDSQLQAAFRNTAIPKITDFGLAKRLGEKEGGTLTGEVLGTPSYMAPEQASGKGQGVGRAADVYALGAILYEMLTGRPPFKGAAPIDTVIQVLHEEPVRPTSLRPDLPRDLETICLKCLEKEPRKRYARASDLADDLHRFRQGKPILARPVGVLERGVKWARRRPLSAALVGGIILVTTLGFAGVVWQWHEATLARDVALQEKRQKELQTLVAENALREAEAARGKEADARERARASLYFSRIARSQLQWRVNDLAGALHTLDSCRPLVTPIDRRGWEWFYLNGLFHSELVGLAHPRSGDAGSVAFRADGERIAAILGDAGHESQARADVRIWSARDGSLVRSLRLPGTWQRLAYRADGQEIALASADGFLRVIDAETGEDRFRRRVHSGAILGIAYSPNGKALVTASWDRTAEVCDARTGEVKQTLRGHTDRVQAALFHPDGKRVATAGWDGAVKVWDIETGEQTGEFLGHKGPVYCVAFSPDGKLLASAGSNGNLKIWELAAGRTIQSLTGHAGSVLDLHFSPDGRYLAYGGGDGTVRVWDVESGIEGVLFRGHAAPVESVRFSPDGQRLVSSSPGDGTVKVWDYTRHPRFATFAHARSDIEAISFHPGANDLLTFTVAGRLQRWDAVTGVLLDEHDVQMGEGPPMLATFDPSGRRLAFRSRENPRSVIVWDTSWCRAVYQLEGHAASIACLRFSSDGRRLVTCANETRPKGAGCEIKVWDMADGQRIGSLDREGGIAAAVFDPEARLVALAKKGGDVTVIDLTTQALLHRVSAHVGDTAAVAFSPDGKLLASAGLDDRTVKIWTVAALGGGNVRPLRTSAPPMIGDLAFAPDGRRLAAVSRDLVQVWDSATGQDVLTLRGAPQRHWDPPFNPRLAFSADGNRLAASNWNETISVWDADMPDDPAEFPAYQARRRVAADQRATFWHLQEAQHCLEHKNPAAARFHLGQLEGKKLSPMLETLKQRVEKALN
ncbi:hypothetical protein AYO40_01895 [Planctomycetaceae bacterium SCGC AG-212-D15]|nr:hypothetical protein AYO40_01895 [Planctomycetaceae bacterium SCGC AG-212-D15]